MLVLTRRLGQAIVLPSCNVIVTVMRVSSNRVKLGITAPVEVAVHRQEVWTRLEDVTPPHPCQPWPGRQTAGQTLPNETRYGGTNP